MHTVPASLLTGATGMVGSYVMAELLRRGVSLAVMARPKGPTCAEQRIQQILSRFESAWGASLPRPRVITASLGVDGLAIDKPSRDWITQHCDQIIHSAANLNFSPASEHPEHEPYQTNVDGSQRLLQFCQETGVGKWHHISTAYVCGKRSGRVLEGENNVGQDFANDYERSKSIAEEQIGSVYSGSSLTLYRPSIVVDPSGLAPVSGDRTIYGAYSMYQMLSARFGLPEDGVWFRNLGFGGHEQKNLVDVGWIARAVATIACSPEHHGRTHHLTSTNGTPINTLDRAFRTATARWLEQRKQPPRQLVHRKPKRPSNDQQAELSAMAAPYVDTFLPYFRDDPVFDRTNIDAVIANTDLDPPPMIGHDELITMIGNWTSPAAKPAKRTRVNAPAPDPSNTASSNSPDDVVICGYAVRLPGDVNDADDFERLLFEGRSAISKMPADRLDRSLYFDSRRGVPGKTYTEVGGCVDPAPLDASIQRRIETLGDFDLTHQQFAQVGVAALMSAFGADPTDKVPSDQLHRGGVFVGHSGGTQSGGPLAMATLAETATSLMAQPAIAAGLDAGAAQQWIDSVTDRVRQTRPARGASGGTELGAYHAASLVARLTGLRGRREVIDAACSSSLIALGHACQAIDSDRLDFALVGGATFNNVDNLALFSQSGACSDSGSHPFDRRASGLISSEGYVGVVLARRSFADQHQMPVHAVVKGVGIASDGKGKGLWAPRTEGQQLAMQRAVPEKCLDVDYLECHATSTQVGDATELESLTCLLGQQAGTPDNPLPIGSVKSNLGHLLEAAGLVGLVKCLLAMKREQIPPSINFSQPTEQYPWEDAPVRVVAQKEAWGKRQRPQRSSAPAVNSVVKSAGVNAFGIGGLNAHAVIEQSHRSAHPVAKTRSQTGRKSVPGAMAIVGRGLILPGASSVGQFASLLAGSRSQLTSAPPDRWMNHPFRDGQRIGINRWANDYTAPHCVGGYVREFDFDAQSYRIPPKLVGHANPAQLMLIEAAKQAIEEFDQHQWTIPRERVGVSVGTIFGGQFSNELQVGLRLPELAEHFRQAASQMGLDPAWTGQLVESYRERVLKRFSALLDETGGFTASTLASAIARVFNLMGGAFAVDADQASSGLALITAQERLDAGDVDLVICGATHRAMDLVTLEQLYRKGQLVESGLPEDIPDDGSRIFPGEGVATILLQRLEDAVAQGRQIFGVIDNLREGWTDHVSRTRADKKQVVSQELVAKIGHLGGAHGLVQVIASTLSRSSPQHPRANRTVTIDDMAEDGYRICYRVGPHLETNTTTTPRLDTPEQAPVTNKTLSSDSRAQQPAATPGDSRDVLTVRLQTSSAELMADALQSVLEQDQKGWQGHVDTFGSVASINRVQAAIVGSSLDDIRQTARELLDGPVANQSTMALPRRHGWIRMHPAADRTAWLFPGQGSQYAAVPEGISQCHHASEFLTEFDKQLASLGIETVSDRLDDPQGQLGTNVWWTQLWVLAVGTALTRSLLARGHRPDYVLGHSFGECTAAWCAGVMSTRQAIEFAKHRSEAVVTTAPRGGQLLSVRAQPAAVDAVLQGSDIDYTITHHNAPEQTVIAGAADQIAVARQRLLDSQIAAMVIPVPAAFHTPQMRPAQDLLAARFAGQPVRPPRFGYLSAISNRYLAEPAQIVSNLIEQLTRPVCFASSIERLVADGCGLMVEVGPSDVLTRLARTATHGRVICLSADTQGRDHKLQQVLVATALEAFGVGSPSETSRGETSHGRAQPPSGLNGSANVSPPAAPVRPPTQPPVRSPSKFQVVDVSAGRGVKAPPVTARKPAAQSTLGQSPAPIHETPSRHAASASASGQPPVAPAAVPDVSRQAVRSASVANQTTGNPSKVSLAKAFLFDLVVDLTGYDPEIVEFDADLEGELGVDSIKKAQLIGELAQWGDLQLDQSSMRLSQFNSLNDILELIGPDEQIESDRQMESTDSIPADTGFSHAVDSGDIDTQASLSESLQRMIIDLVVDQTGYDEDIIDMDADLEGELGVDSIKRAQLLGELETHYQLESLRDQNLRLSDFPTLASIHAYVLDFLTSGDEKKKDTPLAEPATFPAPTADSLPVPAHGTHRFILETVDAPRRVGMPENPQFHGDALVVGQNAVAHAIAKRFAQSGYAVHRIDAFAQLEQLDDQLQEVWNTHSTPHLFLTTPHDDAASWSTLNANGWADRWESGLAIPYRVCQLWMQRMIDDGLMDQASLVSVVKGGGDLGICSEELSYDSIDVSSAETGGIAGLTKAMLIEAWMRGYRDTPMLVVDSGHVVSSSEGSEKKGFGDRSAARVVDGVWRELAVPSYDEEVIVWGEQRKVLSPVYRPLDQETSSADRPPQLTPGGTWIVAGGGRGITAMTAMSLAERHGLKLHLLGMAKAEPIDAPTRQAAIDDRNQLRRETMKRVQNAGGNPVKHWRNYEKAVEIDQTLQECRRRGIQAAYHSIDVSDAAAVTQLVDQIRAQEGPIHGVIQGAGSGQDARFDRKRPDKVRQCLQAKIDGCAALAAATQSDPLEWFIGFGSISGRFGANGHTDYSAANDMLAKMIGRLRLERPQTRCVTFHWHAWGDVGMATKPEAKLALDMIGMNFMPAQEGLQHFLSEVELGGQNTEVLITDRRYTRKFFPARASERSDYRRSPPAAMLDPSEKGWTDRRPDEHGFQVTLDPANDLFLREHLVAGRPTLPMVMAVEMMAQAALVQQFFDGAEVMKPVRFENVRALRPIKCLTDDAFAVELVQRTSGQPDRSTWSLTSDLRRRDGRLVEASREHFQADVILGSNEGTLVVGPDELLLGNSIETRLVEYLPSDAPVYHGPPLRCLRCLGYGQCERNGRPQSVAVGTIVAPSPAHLAGEDRPLDGWITSPATLDAVLYAAGALAYHVGKRPSLPVAFETIQLGRLPDPGEPLRVVVRWEGDWPSGSGVNPRGNSHHGKMSAILAGQNGDLILRINDYQIGWLA